jgi:hypothetical protein
MNNVQQLQHQVVLAMAVATELVRIKTLLEANKPLYEQLEKLTLQLKELVGTEEVALMEEQVVLTLGGPVFAAPQYIRIVDNFSDKNTVFRPAAVKRFEMASETMIERRQRVEKEVKKAAKAAAKG